MRTLCQISPKIGQLLVDQLAHELKNYNLYKTYANCFNVDGILSLDTYYKKRADEELVHHNWIFDYLSKADYKFTYPPIEQNTEKTDDYVKIFKDTVTREIQTTDLIYAIYKVCIEEEDYMTSSWLYNHLITEQVEEESTSRMAVTIIEEDADIYLRASKILCLLNG